MSCLSGGVSCGLGFAGCILMVHLSLFFCPWCVLCVGSGIRGSIRFRFNGFAPRMPWGCVHTRAHLTSNSLPFVTPAAAKNPRLHPLFDQDLHLVSGILTLLLLLHLLVNISALRRCPLPTLGLF